MSKKLLILLAIIIVILLALHHSPSTPTEAPVLFAESRPYCFVYRQPATPDAPYNVEEHIALTRVRDTVSGTKSGTQQGPDMTNGYEGTLSGKVLGSINVDQLELTYAYTIEGSNNTEIELYSTIGDTLIKHRYALADEVRDGKHVLVPDTTSTQELETYVLEKCGE